MPPKTSASSPRIIAQPRRIPTLSSLRHGYLTLQGCGCGCKGEAGAGSEAAASESPPTFVYALGTIEPRFPNLSVEKEYAQVLGRADTAGLTDMAVRRQVLTTPANRYLARQMAWVFTIERVDTYYLMPREPAGLDLLLSAIRPGPALADVDVVVGEKGPAIAGEGAGGMLPVCIFDQIYSFNRDELIAGVPAREAVGARAANGNGGNGGKAKDKGGKPRGLSPGDGERQAYAEMFDRILQAADNAGATDDHRALNYLAVRSPQMYHLVAQMYEEAFSLTGLDVAPSRLSESRKLAGVVLRFTHRETGVTQDYYARVDVTEQFPFLAGALSQTYDRP